MAHRMDFPPPQTTTRAPIRRPPPKHPGVSIPGVSHPPDSGSIQDIIASIDDSKKNARKNLKQVRGNMSAKNDKNLPLHQ